LLAVPLAVQNLTFRILTDTSVNITWSKPQNNSGFDGPLTYIVECYRGTNESNGDTAGQNPFFNTTLTYVVVSNLTLGETYKFKIGSTNSLRNVPRENWRFSERNFTLTGLYRVWNVPVLIIYISYLVLLTAGAIIMRLPRVWLLFHHCLYSYI
jgi:hypothetical protein